MALGAPPKSKRRDWHPEARRLRFDEHWTYQRIATLFDVTAAAVYFVCHPDRRAAYYETKKGAKDVPRAPEPVKP